jgi:hypothetical protein
VAETDRAPVRFTVQLVPETASQPIQPENSELPSATATSVTCFAGVVFGNVAVHPALDPVAQEIPSPVIVPFPVPLACAVSTNVLGANVAVTVFA